MQNIVHHSKKLHQVLLFPGQGSQFVGMGKQLFQNHVEARKLFSRADEVLNFSLSSLMFDGNIKELTKPKNAQPAILIHSIALFEISKKFRDFSIGCVFGHSLGEYTALVISKSLQLEDALKLVRARGEYMESCVNNNEEYEMVALIGCSLSQVKEFCELTKKEFPNLVCEIANINSENQIVISGHKKAIEFVIETSRKQKIRAIKLQVGAPFHCSLMRPASEKLYELLKKTTFKLPIYPVISNVTAKKIEKVEEIPILLKDQVYKPVQWVDSVRYCTNQIMKDKKFEFLEIGPKRTLASLVNKCIPQNIPASTIEDVLPNGDLIIK